MVGRNFPPGFARTAISKAVSAAQFALIGVAVAGDQAFSALGMAPPAFYPSFKANRWQYGIASWFIGNTVSNSVVSTGAFEIRYNDKPVFSKLSIGRMPTMDEVLNGVKRELIKHLGRDAAREFMA